MTPEFKTWAQRGAGPPQTGHESGSVARAAGSPRGCRACKHSLEARSATESGPEALAQSSHLLTWIFTPTKREVLVEDGVKNPKGKKRQYENRKRNQILPTGGGKGGGLVNKTAFQ